MNNLNNSDLNLSQNGGVFNSSQGQNKNMLLDLQLRFRHNQEQNNSLTNRIAQLLTTKQQESQQLTDHNSQLKCTMKMLNFSRTKIDQCNDALSNLCKHQNLIVDVINKIEEYRLNIERKVNNIETKCKTSNQKLSSKLQKAIDKENEILKENNDVKLKLNEIIEENTNLKKAIEKHKINFKRIDSEFNEQISKLNYDKEKIEMEFSALSENLINIKKQNMENIEELNKAKVTIAKLEDNIKQKDIDLSVLKETIVNLQNDKNSLNNDIQSYKDKIKNISETLTATNQEMVKKSESYINLENEKLNLQKEIQLLNNNIDQLNQKILLDTQKAEKKENDFNLREQLLQEEKNRLIIRVNSFKESAAHHKKPLRCISKPEPLPIRSINDWDTNTSLSDITEISEKRIDLFSKPSKYISLPKKRKFGNAGYVWSSQQNNKIAKPNTDAESNLPSTQHGSTEEIVTSSCK